MSVHELSIQYGFNRSSEYGRILPTRGHYDKYHKFLRSQNRAVKWIRQEKQWH